MRKTEASIVRLSPHRLLSQSDPLFFEFWSACYAVATGLWLVNPVYETFVNSPSWQAAAALAPEPVWGMLLIGLGSLHLLGLWGRRLRLRIFTTLLSLAVWAAFGSLFLAHMANGLTWITYLSLALGSLWCFLRLASVIPPEQGPVHDD